MDVKWLLRRIYAKCVGYMTPIKHIYSIQSRQENAKPAVKMAAGKALCQNGKRCFWTCYQLSQTLMVQPQRGCSSFINQARGRGFEPRCPLDSF